MLLALLYVWFAEPTSFQREASARNLISHLGEDNIRPEYRRFSDAATCKLASGVSEVPGMIGLPFVAVACTFDTPCGEVVSRPVYHEPVIGAYITGDPFLTSIGIACPEMLTAKSQSQFESDWQKGG